jgi:hypothetical protein
MSLNLFKRAVSFVADKLANNFINPILNYFMGNEHPAAQQHVKDYAHSVIKAAPEAVNAVADIIDAVSGGLTIESAERIYNRAKDAIKPLTTIVMLPLTAYQAHQNRAFLNGVPANDQALNAQTLRKVNALVR